MKTILLTLLSGLCLSASAAKPGIEQATVTLPYTKLLGLLERANIDGDVDEEAPPKPPVDVLVQSAIYRIDCRDAQATSSEASFSVVNLSEKWQSVFLVEASEVIRSLDPPDAKLVQIDGGMHLLLEPNNFQGMEVKPVQSEWDKAGRLPEWVAAEVGTEPLNYIALAESKSLKISARLLPRLKTASATVPHAEYQTQLVAEGGMLRLSKQICDDETPFASLYYTKKDLQRCASSSTG